MIVKVSRSQRAAARRLIEIAEAEGQPVDERLEAIANAEPAKRSEEELHRGPTSGLDSAAREAWMSAGLARALATPRGSLLPGLWRSANWVAQLTPSIQLAAFPRSGHIAWEKNDVDFMASLARAFEAYKEKEKDETESRPT